MRKALSVLWDKELNDFQCFVCLFAPIITGITIRYALNFYDVWPL